MKRVLYVGAIALTLALAQSRVTAQESAAGGQAATSPASAGQLAPPADNAPKSPSATATPAPSASSANLDARDVASIRQEEIIRRQELIFRANESLKTGRNAEVSQQYPEARKDYLFSAEAFSSISRSTDSYATAAEGLTRVDFQLFDAALKAADTQRAKLLMEEVVKYNPNNQLANEKLAAINRAIDNPNDTSMLGNPAVTPAFVNRVNEVQQLFAEAEQFRRTGQWDEAEARLKRILGIDQYNIAATKQLERIDAEKLQYDEVARTEMRDERLRQVEEKWYEPINNPDSMTGAQEGQQPIVRTTNFGLDQKLKNIYLSLDFNNATIEEATNFLSVESARLDPDHKGVSFVIQPEASSTAKPVTLTLNNVPLGEALRYVCQLANVKFKVQDYAISIVPFSASIDELVSRTFIVQPNFVAPPSATGTIESAANTAFGGGGGDRPVAPAATPNLTTDESSGDTVRQALIAKGIKFPPGASAVYTPVTGQLTVVDTADQMELVEELVRAGQAPTLMVRIATKFIEINQLDLNDLTVNTAFNFLIPPDIASPINGTPSFVTQLPGANAISPDSIDALINPQATTFNTLSFRGFLNNSQFNLLIQALSQKTSTDELSDPAVLTKSGEQGVMEAVQVFPYPISFDPPELVTQSTTGVAVTTVSTYTPPTVIATTPTDFKRRNVGVRLVVKPQVTADNRTIDLSLFPEVTDFEGFINYGSPIIIPSPEAGVAQTVLSTNQIPQPVFNTRRINTKVLVRDGSTVVLGGLIRDDIQNVNDKVPFLGDLPLIGRLFQSKAIQNTKRNLLIFVTANIYQNDGELLNQPEVSNTADILTGRAGFAPAAQ